ncbi:Uncharacterised protein [Bordetella pertussis]|nr:Uncharacterised protein [Bordetella pertussis]
MSSVSLSSWMHSASTGLAASQSSTCGRRTFRELTFQVASFTGSHCKSSANGGFSQIWARRAGNAQRNASM